MSAILVEDILVWPSWPSILGGFITGAVVMALLMRFNPVLE